MIREDVEKHPTLCWTCDKARGRCSWSKNFTPVKGWTAIPTKINKRKANGKIYFTRSFDVYECPEYELLKEIKQDLLAPEYEKGKQKRTDAEERKLIADLRFFKNKPVSYICAITGYTKTAIYRILRKEKENESK